MLNVDTTAHDLDIYLAIVNNELKVKLNDKKIKECSLDTDSNFNIIWGHYIIHFSDLT